MSGSVPNRSVMFIALVSTVAVACVAATITMSVQMQRMKSETNAQRASKRTITFRPKWPSFELTQTIHADGRSAHDKAQPGDQFGVLSLKPDGKVLAVGAELEEGAESNNPRTGAVYISVCSPDVCEQAFVVRGETSGEGFGRDVAVAGNRVFVLSWKAVHVFRSVADCSLGRWHREGEIPFECDSGLDSGMSAAQSTALLVLHTEQGFVELYAPNEKEEWVPMVRKKVSRSQAVRSVKLDSAGRWMAVGTDKVVKLFEILDGAKKMKERYNVKVHDPVESFSFSADSTTLAIGVPSAYDIRGKVVILQRNHQTDEWTVHSDYRIDGLKGDAFGYPAISPNGLTLAVGAPTDTTSGKKETVRGAVYVFRRLSQKEDFQIVQKLAYPGETNSAWSLFGKHMSFSENGSTLFVSAIGCGDFGAQSGAVFQYSLRSRESE